MRALIISAALALSACDVCIAIENDPPHSVGCPAAGSSTIPVQHFGGRHGQGSVSCTARLDGGALSLEVSGTTCGDNGNNPVVNIMRADCVVPPLAPGRYAVTGGLTLNVPADGGVAECTE